jgi:hypothetical protein
MLKNNDRRAKMAFLVVAILVAGVVYFLFQSGEEILKNWPADFNATLADANQTGRNVLVVFLSNPPNDDSVFVATTTLTKPKNRQAIEAGKFARVKTVVNDLNGPLAGKYKLTKLPTLMVLDSKGKEVARAEGRVGEVPFLEFIQSIKKP